MNFKLSNLSVVNGARYVDGKLIITVHITSKIEECPYENKFEQVDYNVDLELPEDKTPAQLNDMLPTIAQAWVTENYPNT